MPGLMESLFAGAAHGFSNATQQNNAAEISNLNRQTEFSIRELMDQRIADRNKTTEADQHARNRGEAVADHDMAHKNKLEEIDAAGKWQSKNSKDPVDNESKKFTLEQAKRKDAWMQDWSVLKNQYDTAKDEDTRKYLFPKLQQVETQLASIGVNPNGTNSTEIKEDPLTGENSARSISKTGVRTQAPIATNSANAPPEAVAYLRKNPDQKAAFKQKYGYLPEGM